MLAALTGMAALGLGIAALIPASARAVVITQENPLPEPAPTLTLESGWNLVGWPIRQLVEQATAPIAEWCGAVYTYDAAARQFRSYTPGLSPNLNTLREFLPGEGLWIYCTRRVQWPLPVVAPETGPVALVSGFNLVMWTGADGTPAAQAFVGISEALAVAYTYDAVEQRFRTYLPGAPTVVNDLERLRYGEGMLILARTPVTWEQPTRSPGPPGSAPPSEEITVTVTFTESTYRATAGGTSGIFHTGQEADLMLSGIGFNQTGGPLLFNHPAGIATDDRHLLLSDRNNNRVLIWNTLPEGNEPPDLVLGQPAFDSNAPGEGLDELSWPSEADTDGTRIVVADTYNERILIWTRFPTENAQPADIVLHVGPQLLPPGTEGGATRTPNWPWGVWTDGTQLAVSATGGGVVLLWNQFPTRDDQAADLYLRAGGQMGTPRHITSDGTHLLVGDHNPLSAGGEAVAPGTWVWAAWPERNDEPFSYFLSNPSGGQGVWLRGEFTEDGRLILLGDQLYVWREFPATASTPPTLTVNAFAFHGGDGEDIAIAGERLYIAMYNGDRVVAYTAFPASPEARPDFAIGAPDVDTNPLDTHSFLTNPVPASDGTSLFVSSDFDKRLYVWRQRPDEDGAAPDLVYQFSGFGPWDNALHEGRLALAGRNAVLIWTSPPLDGQQPDRVLRGEIGGVRLQEVKGVALDDRYFYLADAAADAVYIWDGLPDGSTAPRFTLPVERPERLSSDGTYLAVTTTFDHSVLIYRIAALGREAPVRIGGVGRFNLPGSATVAGGMLFVADTPWSRVLIWQRVESAIEQAQRGEFAPDVVLGKESLTEHTPAIGRDTLFWPGAVAWDGDYVWVGEFKFSGRLLRFSPSP